MKLNSKNVPIHPHHSTPLTAATIELFQDRPIYTDALRYTLRSGIYHPAVIKFWWLLIKTWERDRETRREMLAEGKTDDRPNRDDDRWFNEELTGWKGRKPIRRHNRSMGTGRKRWKERNGKARWMNIGSRWIKTAIERISEQWWDKDTDREIWTQRAAPKTEVEWCRLTKLRCRQRRGRKIDG